jgi:hypothetical protein
MERLALIARLKPGSEVRADDLIKQGPPFDPAEIGFTRHSVYLSATEVVFVFEGQQVEWMVDDLVEGDFLHPRLSDALEAWRAVIDGAPRIAREKFSWERAAEA